MLLRVLAFLLLIALTVAGFQPPFTARRLRCQSSARTRTLSLSGKGFGKPAAKGFGKAVQSPKAPAATEAGVEIDGVAEALSSNEPAKQKSKTDRFDLQFTCNVCESRNKHSISRHAYTRGTVIVTCPECKSAHLIADNLNWIEDDFRNVEELMQKRGTPVTRVVSGGAAAEAAAAAEKAQPAVTRVDASNVDRIDGISEDQALRIREAVRANKRRRPQEAAEAAAATADGSEDAEADPA